MDKHKYFMVLLLTKKLKCDKIKIVLGLWKYSPEAH